MITQERLKELWSYRAETDDFIWLTATRFRKIGDKVKNHTERINIDSTEYRYSRLYSLYHTGKYNITSISNPVTYEELIQVLKLDFTTHTFFWKEERSHLARNGSEAGHLDTSTGYITIRLGRVPYLAHRLVWLYYYQEWPKQYIDHIDRNKLNNRLDNLRDVSQLINGRNRGKNKNNTSGFKGVHLNKDGIHWNAEIIINRVRTRLGTFGTAEEASLVYEKYNEEHGIC